MKLINMQVMLNVVMGLLDDDGDVVQQIPIQVVVKKLDEQSILAALQEAKAKRAEIESQVPQPQQAPQEEKNEE